MFSTTILLGLCQCLIMYMFFVCYFIVGLTPSPLQQKEVSFCNLWKQVEEKFFYYLVSYYKI